MAPPSLIHHLKPTNYKLQPDRFVEGEKEVYRPLHSPPSLLQNSPQLYDSTTSQLNKEETTA